MFESIHFSYYAHLFDINTLSLIPSQKWILSEMICTYHGTECNDTNQNVWIAAAPEEKHL